MTIIAHYDDLTQAFRKINRAMVYGVGHSDAHPDWDGVIDLLAPMNTIVGLVGPSITWN